MSDLHLCDAESPARQEYLDRLGDPGAPYAHLLGEIGTYRPQEVLTGQVALAALAAAARLERGPLTGAPTDALLLTGDLTDNAQTNELDWYATLMRGGTFAVRSGGPASGWVGASGSAWSPAYWHPDGPPRGAEPDLPTTRYGFPRVPGLAEAAREPLVSPGSPVRWLSVHGNHDALLQGTVAPEDLRDLAVGGRRIVGLAEGQTPFVALEGAAPVGPARYTHDETSPWEPVVPDARRALVGERDFARAVGAGLAGADRPAGARYWATDVGQARVIALDTVNPYGGWQGSLDTGQLTWLADELTRSAGRYVVVSSHHPSWTLTNGHAPAGVRRHLADEVLGLLLRHPGVIAWVAGHVHRHTSHWHQAPGRAGGLWEVTTASLIDWPQQLRVLELVADDGQLYLGATVVDHLGVGGEVLTTGRADLTDPFVLAGWSRALAANDYRLRSVDLASSAADRNAWWQMPDPFA